MKISKIQILFFLILLNISCIHTEKKEYFNGEICIIDLPNQIDTLEGKQIILNDIYAGDIFVNEKIACFISYQHPDSFLYTFDLETGNKIGNFCIRGNGPNEFASIFCFQQWDIDDKSVKLWVGRNETELLCLDLTNSINLGKSVYTDVKHSLNWEDEIGKPFATIFGIDEEIFLAKIPPLTLYKNDVDYMPTEYRIINSLTGTTKRKFLLYNHPVINPKIKNDIFFPVDLYLASYDKIKPDKSKVAMGMLLMSQINILDLKTGKLKGIRIKNTPDFQDLEVCADNFHIYNYLIRVDDKYIYVPYIDKNMKEINTASSSLNEIHIYNWEGEFIKRLYLKRSFGSFDIDNKNNLLYAKSNEDDEIYCYQLN